MYDNYRFDDDLEKISQILANEQLDTVIDYCKKHNISITDESGEYKCLSTIIDEVIRQWPDFSEV